jgi:TrkA domain protein
MKIKEADLPGIGRKYTVYSAEGEMFVILIHHSGRREIYLMADEDDDEPVYTLNLTDDEARKVGSILLGADFQPVSDDRLEIMMNNLFIEWIKVTEESPLANQTIRESRVKEITGATIIGIQRGNTMIGSPSAEERLLPEDMLMVVGKRDQVRMLEPMCKEKGICHE